MKKKYIALMALPLLCGCAQTGIIDLGKMYFNDTEKDAAGLTIELKDDCSPKRIRRDVPFCGYVEKQEGVICTTEARNGYRYKIVQMLDQDALICAVGSYGNFCVDQVAYVKDIAKVYTYLMDDVYLGGNDQIVQKPVSYVNGLNQKRTVLKYEAVNKYRYNKIKYSVERGKCSGKKYSYSWNKDKGWFEDK